MCLQVKKQGPFKVFLFNAALHWKQMWMKLGWSTTAASPICNKIFFSKTQVPALTSGRAPYALQQDQRERHVL